MNEDKMRTALEALKAKIAELEEKLAEKEETDNSLPRKGNHYWFIGICGRAYRSIYWGAEDDKDRISIGNMFEGKGDAARAVEGLKEIAEMKRNSEREGKAFDKIITSNVAPGEIRDALIKIWGSKKGKDKNK